MLIQNGTQNILIDAGWGKKIDKRHGQTLDALAVLGLSAQAIDVVVLSHAHVDHYLGLLMPDGSKTFPNARYVMYRPEWDYYSSDAYLQGVDEERRVFMTEHFVPLGKYLSFLGDDLCVADGVTAILAPGHTKHHLAFEITSAGHTLIFAADAFPHPYAFNYLHWHWPFEYSADDILQTRQQLIARSLQPDTMLAGYHFAFPPIGQITQDGDKMSWHPKE